MINLLPHQEIAVEKLKTGSILCGGVGTGKSITSLYYFYTKICGGIIENGRPSKSLPNPLNLYIITTARKRDSLDWEKECSRFDIESKGVAITVDSWNNIGKYISINNSFFIFDEQRVIGYGSWVKSFLDITKNNEWILLTATPGDTWLDYLPVFIANGFYKHKTDFVTQHVIYNRFTKFQKVGRYVGTGKLIRLRQSILVNMNFEHSVERHHEIVKVGYDEKLFNLVYVNRWNPFEDRPIREVSEYFSVMRRVVNSDNSRMTMLRDLINKHDKIIVFYNFDYELEILRKLKERSDILVSEWNGHKHEDIPKSKRWVYLVQYQAGAEAWNCIETNIVVFYSRNYSYKMTKQAAGRIDRLNTPFANLYYYYLTSNSKIDIAIGRALQSKKEFNEEAFLRRSRKIQML